MNTNLDMDWTGNQGLSDSELMNIASGCGYDITIGANNGEEIRRANQTKPWPNDQEVNSILSESTKEESSKDRYLTFTVLGNKVGSISLTTTMSTPPSIQYSLDNGETWEDYIFGDGKLEGTGFLELNSGDSVKFKGNNTSLTSMGGKAITKFAIPESMAASGDVTSLLNGIGGDCELTEYCFCDLFNGCTGLVEAPQLPSTILADGCYRSMFADCTGLVEAPQLPATTLAEGCYSGMFRDCTSLTRAPELLATTLTDGCYYEMFRGCTSLGYIKCLATNISASSCTIDWVNGVSGSGTFVKDPNMESWTIGDNGIPEGWTIEDNN